MRRRPHRCLARPIVIHVWEVKEQSGVARPGGRQGGGVRGGGLAGAASSTTPCCLIVIIIRVVLGHIERAVGGWGGAAEALLVDVGWVKMG